MSRGLGLGDRSQPARIAWIGLVLLLLIKLGLVGLTLTTPEGGVLIDSEDYLALAEHLANAGRYEDPQGWARDFTRPPGYPLFLYALRGLFGSATAPIVLAQLFLASATAILVLRMGTTLSRPGLGMGAAWLFALSPNATLWSLTLMTETLFTFLVVAALAAYLLMRGRHFALRAGILGLAVGISAYVRPIGLLLLPVWAGLVGWQFSRSERGRRWIGALVVFLLVALAVVTPWHLRNRARHGQLAMTNVGAKTWVGFNLAEVVAQATGLPRSEAVELVEEEGGVVAATLDTLRRHPRAFVQVQALGWARTVAGTDIGTWGNVLGWDTWKGFGLLSGVFGREIDYGIGPLAGDGRGFETWLHRGLMSYSLLYSLILSLLVLAGLIRGLRAERYDWVWVPLTLAIFLILVPAASGQARFRVPAEPFLALVAAIGIAGLDRGPDWGPSASRLGGAAPDPMGERARPPADRKDLR